MNRSNFISRLFTPADQDRIAAAVAAAEGQSAGEIVPYVVQQSDMYEDASWRAALLGAFLALGVMVLLRQYTNAWLPEFITIAFIVVVAAGAGFILTDLIPAMTRLLAGKALIELRISQRAAEAFIAEEIFNTRDRTGILIFISLLERRVLVIGDAGINAKVKQEEWDAVASRVANGLRRGKPAEGLLAAIEQCGVLLQKRGVERRVDDDNELSNKLRIGE